MNIPNVISLCVKSINTTPKEITPTITLIMKDKKWGKSGMVYLGKNRTGPKGNAIQETEDGLWVIFEATDVLAYIMAISDLRFDETSSGIVLRSKREGER